MPATDAELARQVGREYGLTGVRCRPLDTLVNDVLVVDAAQGRFALKLYHARRTVDAVAWELELVEHLVRGGAPVAPARIGRSGPVARLLVAGRARIAALFAWAPGAKPEPTDDTYVRLGAVAARIHRAADGWTAPVSARGRSNRPGCGRPPRPSSPAGCAGTGRCARSPRRTSARFRRSPR